MKPTPLPYERRSGGRSILIDEDEAGVSIRILHQNKPLRGIGVFFIAMGLLFTVVMLANNPPRTNPAQAILAACGGVFFCLLGIWAFVPPHPVPTNIIARADGLEIYDGQLGTSQSWPREQIVSVVTDGSTAELPGVACQLILRLREDESVVLGLGTVEEVRELAVAIRRGLKMPELPPMPATPPVPPGDV